MTPELNLLHQLLTYLNEDNNVAVENGVYSPSQALVHAVLYLAEDCLTGADGDAHIHYLRQQGWDIHPGDQDRFGWLTGCIQLRRGMIVFG